jgi:hypothetical protein
VQADHPVDGEGYAGLIDRIVIKAGLDKPEAESVRRGKDGAGLVYEFDGARWSLEDGECGERPGATGTRPVRFTTVLVLMCLSSRRRRPADPSLSPAAIYHTLCYPPPDTSRGSCGCSARILHCLG